MEVEDVFRYRGRFFQVLQETERSQTAVMTIAPGAEAGPAEEHDGDQVVYVVEGEAIKTRHHVRNTGSAPLFFLTVYAPPEY